MNKKQPDRTISRLKSELEDLRIRLLEAEETLEAIRGGSVDAIVVSGTEGERVFSLASAETPYRIILEQINLGAATLSSDGLVLYCNHSFAELLSIPAEKIIGSKCVSFLPPAARPVFEALLKEGLKGKASGDISLKTRDKNLLHLNLLFKSLPDKIEGDVCIIISDITSRQSYQEHLENEVKKATHKLDLALENANIGLWEWDLTTDKVSWDVRTERMLGLKPGAYEMEYATFENCIHEEDLPNLREKLQQAVDFSKPYDTVFRTRPVEGNYNYLSAKGIVSRDNSGKPLNIACVCFDITSMKKGSEQALFRINEELLRSNKDLQEFAYVASHDLQEPLRMVSSFTQLIEQRYFDIVDDDGREFIRFAVEGSKRMYDLLNALLKYSRVETKGKTFAKVDMNVVLKKVTSNLSLRIREKKARITIAELPVVLADDSQMIQLFQNLIENSIKFSKEVPVIRISSKDQRDNYLFSVKDEGIGIESQYFDRIFKIFQRLNPKEEYAGTGIGLSISRRIIERHGGKIWLESKPGKGTTFFFTIPKAQYNR